MTRLLKSTACALVSSILLLGPAAQATHGLHHHDNINNNNNNAAAAGTDDEHGHHHQRQFHVREVRFSPFIVDSSKELNKALAILEHESQQCNDFGRRRHRHHNHNDNDADATTAGANRKQGGLRSRKNANPASSNLNHDHHRHKEDEDEERCFGRIKLVKGKTYKLEREFIFADAFKLDLEGHPGATIKAAPGQRHLTFDDEAVLNAHQVAFVDGGCDKEGFVGGSILLVNRASLFARGVNWTNNHAWSGGAIFADDAKRLNVFHGIFKDNSADRKGGAVAIREARRNRKNKHGHHDNDDDDNEGGAAGNRNKNKNKNKANDAAQKRRREVEERRKKQQAARAANNKNNNKNGGNVAGANAHDDKHHGHKRQRRRVSRIKFVRVKFAKNTANKGGAIWNDGSHTEVEDSFFFKNKAHLGGAIFNAKHGRLLVRETAFVENEASAKGGAIFNDGWLWVVCSAFVDNQAPLGCDIFNNGWLKCTSETSPVKIDGNGYGYCTPCTPPQTAAPTVRSTPMRRVKKAEVVEKKHHHGHDHNDNNNGNRGGLFGGLWNKNHNHENAHNEAAETRVFYDYYRHGEGNAYDRWNGYNSALVEEEEDEDMKTGWAYGASGFGSYGADGWAGGAGAGAGDKKQKKKDNWGAGTGGDWSDYGAADDSYYGDEEGYIGEAEGAEDYYGADASYYGDQEGYGYADEGNDYTYYGDDAAGQAYGSPNYAA